MAGVSVNSCYCSTHFDQVCNNLIDNGDDPAVRPEGGIGQLAAELVRLRLVLVIVELREQDHYHDEARVQHQIADCEE